MKILNIIYSSIFIAFIFVVGAIVLFDEDKKVSVSENRSLAQRPDFNLKTFVRDNYFSRFDTYYSDQFFMKEEIVSLGKEVELNVKKKLSNENYTVVNNVLEFDDGYIFKLPEIIYPKDEDIKKKSEAINNLADVAISNGKNVFYINAPYHDATFREYLPEKYKVKELYKYREMLFENLNDDITFIDLDKRFNDKYDFEGLKELYFSSDHHWNLKGSKVAFNYTNSIITKELKVKNTKLDDFEKQTFDNKTFLGSWSRSVGSIFDEIGKVENEILPEEFLKDLKTTMYKKGNYVEVGLDEIVGTTHKAKLEGEKAYTYASLFTDDLAEFQVENPNSITDKTLFVIKDSFFNASVVDYVRYYKKIIVIDPRHLTSMSVEDKIKSYDYDVLLFFYSNNVNYNDYQFQFYHKK